jgi:hypothetical protein
LDKGRAHCCPVFFLGSDMKVTTHDGNNIRGWVLGVGVLAGVLYPVPLAAQNIGSNLPSVATARLPGEIALERTTTGGRTFVQFVNTSTGASRFGFLYQSTALVVTDGVTIDHPTRNASKLMQALRALSHPLVAALAMIFRASPTADATIQACSTTTAQCWENPTINAANYTYEVHQQCLSNNGAVFRSRVGNTDTCSSLGYDNTTLETGTYTCSTNAHRYIDDLGPTWENGLVRCQPQGRAVWLQMNGAYPCATPGSDQCLAGIPNTPSTAERNVVETQIPNLQVNEGGQISRRNSTRSPNLPQYAGSPIVWDIWNPIDYGTVPAPIWEQGGIDPSGNPIPGWSPDPSRIVQPSPGTGPGTTDPTPTPTPTSVEVTVNVDPWGLEVSTDTAPQLQEVTVELGDLFNPSAGSGGCGCITWEIPGILPFADGAELDAAPICAAAASVGMLLVFFSLLGAGMIIFRG